MRLRWILLIAALSIYVATKSDALSPLSGAISEVFTTINGKFPGLPSGIAGALLTALVAWIALRTNAAVNVRNKRIDVIVHCNARYDDLYKLRNEIDREKKTDTRNHLIQSYFRRYWGLQSDQIDYWLAGYVDPETMASWVTSLSDALNFKFIGHGDGSITYKNSWDNEARKTHRVINGRLRETVLFTRRYISRVKSPSHRYAIILHYLRIIEENERSLVRRLSRNHYRRMHIDELATTIRWSAWHHYNQYDSRYLPFRMIYRLKAKFSRLAFAFLDWIQGNSIERLISAIKIAPKIGDNDSGSPD